MGRPDWYDGTVDRLSEDYAGLDRRDIEAVFDECLAALPHLETAADLHRCLELVRTRLDVRRWAQHGEHPPEAAGDQGRRADT